MKRSFKKMLSILLAVVITVSAFGVIGAYAAEQDADAPDAAEAVEATEPAEEAPAEAEQPTEDEDIDLAQTAADPTEAPTQAPTEAEPTVGKVRNIERNSFESDLADLSWDPVEGADGYYVYYLNADRHKNFSRFADVKTNSCTVKPLRQGTQYYFKVSAYVIRNGKVYEGETTLKKTATQPSALTGLTKWRSSTVIEMTWDRNEMATGYRVYRTSPESGNKEVLYKTVYGNTNTTFDDTSIKQGNIYKYRVKSFRELYNTSYSSTAGSETFMAGLCGPNYSIETRCSRVNLSWNKNPYATHYEVYYSTSPDNSKFVKLFTTPRLYYNTTKLTVGKTYYFRVKAIYQSGGVLINGTSNKKSATVTDTAYGEYVGDTYIEVSIDQQHMWVYKDGYQIASTNVVTGNYGDCDTPTGYYEIYSKAEDTYLVGEDYVSYVDYWMAFYGGYGIHDSSWRSTYGGSIYKGDGSHGCVNTPLSAMTTIYNNITYDTPVIIY